MKFLCMGYFDKEKMHGLPAAQLDTVMGECAPHMDALYNTGRVVLDAGLESEVKTIQRQGGEIRMTDGPLTETKDLVGSVFIVEADNMEEAIRLASMHPTTQVDQGEAYGWRTEVRPVHFFKNDTDAN